MRNILALFILMSILTFSCIRKVPQKTETLTKKAFDTAFMDKSVSPISNFDRYANGKWQDSTKLPEGYSRWGAFSVLHNENEDKIKGLIKEFMLKKQVSFSPEQQIGDLYLAYMDSSMIENRKLDPLKSIFREIDMIKDLPMLNTIYFNRYKQYINLWVDFDIDADIKNSRENIVYLYQSGLSIGDRDYYIVTNSRNSKILSEFSSMVAKYLNQIGITDSLEVNRQSEEILDFEMALAQIQISKEARRDPVKTYNKVDIKELVKYFPYLGINSIINSAVFKNIDSVVVQDMRYLKKLNYLLKTTNFNVVKNWVKIKFMNEYADFLYGKIRLANRYFYKEIMNGISTEKPREKRALELVNEGLANLVGKMFVSKYFSKSSKQYVEEMIENMRTVYAERIKANKWMSDTTKKQALTKLQLFRYKIGYPDKWKDYSTIAIDKSYLLENMMHIQEWEYKEMLKKFNQPVDTAEWHMSPQEVNAYYNPPLNEIVFPAGILQPPFYNSEADDAINYGGILAVIGHEFTHGFDDQGSQFDGQGNLKVWWTKEDRDKFNVRASALGKQYTDYTGLKSKSKINAQFTMGENIADLGGVTLAYYALQKKIEKNSKKPKDIDGFNYKQRFFLSWAQVWRTICTDEYEKNQVIGDPHSPANARINVTLSLFPEFYKAWGSQIPKEKEVEIW